MPQINNSNYLVFFVHSKKASVTTQLVFAVSMLVLAATAFSQSDFHFASPSINSPLPFLDKSTMAQMHAYPTIAIIDASTPNPPPVNKS